MKKPMDNGSFDDSFEYYGLKGLTGNEVLKLQIKDDEIERRYPMEKWEEMGMTPNRVQARRALFEAYGKENGNK